MSSQRSRSTRNIGNRISNLESKQDAASRQTSDLKITQGMLEDNSVGPAALEPNAVGPDALARGAVGTENLGIVNEIISDSNLLIQVPQYVRLDGPNYVLPTEAVTVSLNLNQDGQIVLGVAGGAPGSGEIPTMPDAVSVSSDGDWDILGNPYSRITIGWVAVTQSTDATPIAIDRYEIWSRLETQAADESKLVASIAAMNYPSAVIYPVQPNTTFELKVRAISTGGVASEFTSENQIVTVLPPNSISAPSTPTLGSVGTTLSISWDGFLGSGTPPVFFAYTFAEISDAVAGPFTPVGGQLSRAGSFSVANLNIGDTRYVRLRSVDKAGRWSTPSAIANIVIGGPSLVPAAPTGVTLTATGAWDATGKPYSSLKVTWNAVTKNVNGEDLVVDSYEVWTRPTTDVNVPYQLTTTVMTGSALSAIVQPYDANVRVFVQILARSYAGIQSAFSTATSVLMVNPSGKLPAPSTPTLTQKAGVLAVTWDGLLTSGAPPIQFDHLRVEGGTAPTGPWGPVGTQLITKGDVTLPVIPKNSSYWVRFVAVDRLNIDSDPSSTISATVIGVATGDLDSSVTDSITSVEQAAANAQSTADAITQAAVTGSVDEWAQSSSATTTPTTGWSTTAPTWVEGKYIWQRTTVTFGSGSSTTSDPIVLTGNPGSTGADGRGIASAAVTYQASSSGTTPPTGTWTSTVPAVAAGQYLWTRTITTYTDSTTSTAYSVGLMGANGAQGTPGTDGTDGQTTYLHVAYATNSTGTTGFSTTDPSGKTYLGTYTDFTAADSTDPTKYSWSLIKGADGTAGKGISSSTGTYQVGSSGTTAPTGTWTSTVPSTPDGQFLWTRTVLQFTDGASTTTYSVAKQGSQGSQGIPGTPGADGTTYYTWLKYADTPTSGMSDSPTGKEYIGLAMNKTSPTESSVYSDYTWSLIQGPQGIPGTPGADGTTTYTWIKYGTSSAGAGLSDDPTGKAYIGIAYNKTTATESTVATDYTWSLILGPTGPQGTSVSSVTRYYQLAASIPAKPTTNPPPAPWTTTEPSYVMGSTNSLYFVDLAVLSNSTFLYSAVSKSSSFDAAQAAHDAADVAMLSADGKNTIHRSTMDPSGLGVEGDLWWKYVGSNVVGQWRWLGGGAAHASTSSKQDSFGQTLTNIVTNPSFETVNTGTTILRTNLFNGTMSIVGGGSGATLTSGITYDGDTWSQYYEGTTTTASLRSFTNLADLISGDPYIAQWEVANNGTSSVHVLVDWCDLGSSAYDIAPGQRQIISTGGAKVYSTIYRFADLALNANQQILVRNVMVEGGSDVHPFFNGSTTDAFGWDYSWTGTAGASTSVAKAAPVTVRTNLAFDPAATKISGDGTKIAWIPRWFGSGGSGTNTSITGATDGPLPELQTYQRKTWTVAGSPGDTAWALTSYASTGTASTAATPVTANTSYAISAYIRAVSAITGKTVQINIQWRNSSGTYLSTSSSSVLSVTNGVWLRPQIVVTSPSTAAYAEILIYLTGPGSSTWSVGDTLDGTGALAETSSALGDFFYGSTPAAGDFAYAWTSTANASTSVQRAAAITNALGNGGNYAAVYQSGEWSASGGHSLALMNWGAHNDQFVNILGMLPSLQAGVQYTLTGKVKTTVTTVSSSQLSLRASTAGGDLTFNLGIPAGSPPDVYDFQIQFTLATGAVSFFRLQNKTTNPGELSWWDDISIIQGVYTGNYFDGDTSGAWWGGGSWVSEKIDGAVFANIDAGTITVGALDANRISANTISTQKLLVGNFYNLLEDSSFELTDSTAWSHVTSNVTSSTSSPRTGSRVLRIKASTSAYEAASHQAAIPVQEGEEYVFGAWLRAEGSGTTVDGGIELSIKSGSDPVNTNTVTAITDSPVVSSTYTFVFGVYPVPVGVRYIRPRFVVRSDTSNTNVYLIDDATLYKRVPGDLIVDGAITARKIGAGEITSDLIKAGAISANALQANSVTAGAVAAGAITTEKLDVGAVTADKIASGTIQTNNLAPEVGSQLNIAGNVSITAVSSQIGDVSGSLQNTVSDLEDMKTVYAFDATGATISSPDSVFQVKLTNTEIQMLQNGNKVSYWNSGVLYVDSLVGTQVTLGHHKLEADTDNTGTVVRAL